MKIDRLIAIIMILLEREKVSAKELADMFEVSPRTIYQDLDSINQAGIPIAATSGPGGGAEILDTYKVEKRLFSTSDIDNRLVAAKLRIHEQIRDRKYSFFTNRLCEFFPCHDTISTEDFNCLFCFCPLYFFKESCGGNFTLLENGTKDCSSCTFPHSQANYDEIICRLNHLMTLQ